VDGTGHVHPAGECLNEHAQGNHHFDQPLRSGRPLVTPTKTEREGVSP
jgi:hypothetical protein